MKQSLTYYITRFVLRTRIKKHFSKDPIDFKKIRKHDVHHPKGRFFRQNEVRKFQVSNTLVTEIKQGKTSSNLLIFIHGGAFISGPAKHHWDSLKEIIKQTNHTGWMCDYPKAPENKISEISKNIDAVYHTALKKYQSNQIILIGDSVGGTLIVGLMQRLVQQNIELPKRIILISPVMDATMTNPKIEEIEKTDPMLSRVGLVSAKKMCVENGDLKQVMISPINGSFSGFPKTTIFIAENDIAYPDQLLAIQKMNESEVDVEVIKGDNMPHIWPLLPVMKEAKKGLNQLITVLSN